MGSTVGLRILGNYHMQIPLGDCQSPKTGWQSMTGHVTTAWCSVRGTGNHLSPSTQASTYLGRGSKCKEVRWLKSTASQGSEGSGF